MSVILINYYILQSAKKLGLHSCSNSTLKKVHKHSEAFAGGDVIREAASVSYDSRFKTQTVTLSLVTSVL